MLLNSRPSRPARRSVARRPANKPAEIAPPKWQSVATPLLILHLFCLALAVLSNGGGGVSRVGYALRKIPLAPAYLKLLAMDLGYDFELGGAEPQNAAHHLEVARPGEAAPVAQLPADDVSWRIRRQRYQQLAFHVAQFDDVFSENSDLQTMTPLAIADAWLRDLDLPPQRYVLRCRRVSAPRWAAAPEEERERSPTANEAGAGQTAQGDQPADGDEAIEIDLVWNRYEQRYEGARRRPAALTAKAIGDAAPAADAATAEGADVDDAATDAEEVAP